jgi:hypothetical protein
MEKKMRVLKPLAIAAVIAALAYAGPAAAQDAPLGAFTSLVEDGTDGPWQQTITAEAYTMENRSDPNAIRYYWGIGDRDEIGSRTITLEVELVGGGDTARAGILYGYQDEPRSYFAFVLEASGAVALYRRDAAGFNMYMSTVTDALRDGANELSIIESAGTITMFFNGVQTGSYNGAGVGEGAAGIISIGTGRFIFTAYDDTSLN